MPRIRWFHFFLVLAVSDVVVIMLSLQLHQATLASFESFRDESDRLQAQADWVLTAQQRIIEMNAPGNDLFDTASVEEHDLTRRKYIIAKSNMNAALRDAPELSSSYPTGGQVKWQADIERLRDIVALMTAESDQLVEIFERIWKSGAAESEREDILASAGPVMARMDRMQHDGLKTLGILAQRSAGYRNELIDRHDADLNSRMVIERIVIALVITLLAGLLLFGRRLQKIDRALEEEKRRVKEERRERLAAIGELCSSVAHGIRNPLAAIRSSAQLALEVGKMDPDSTDRLKDILNEGCRLGDRVTGLLNMARSNQEGFEKVNLREVVSLAIRELRSEFARRKIGVEEELTAEDVVILGDRRNLEQVVIELLSNAMEQSGENDVVRVACSRSASGTDAVIVVEDQGAGVPDGIRNRIFDLFFTTKPTGTGIGLATVKRVAKLHGGDIVLSNGRAGGARFEVTLPLMRPVRSGRGRRRIEMMNLL